MILLLDLILRQYLDVSTLESSTGIIASFLGPSRNLSLCKICAFGPPPILLDCIWNSICTSVQNRPLQWSLNNYLRSDQHYYRWQFARSLEISASRGDLAIIKWLFKRFEGCEAPTSVVEITARNGHLPLLQFLLDHENDFREKNSEIWGTIAMLRAAENDHVEVLRWLYESEMYANNTEQRSALIEHTLRVGAFELADLLLPTDGTKCVLEYDRMSPCRDLIEWMLDLGYFTWDLHVAGSAIRDLADSGSLDLMQQIFILHSPLEKADYRLVEYWREASERACRCGSLGTLQWLMSIRCRIYQHSDESCMDLNNLLTAAAGGGHINVASYLRDEGVVDNGNAIVAAVQKGHISVVQWLLENYSYLMPRNSRLVVYDAVTCGNIEILELLHQSDLSEKEPTRQWKWLRCISDIEFAASRGRLDVIKWFYANVPLISSATIAFIDGAAAHGHLEVVKWLHLKKYQKCTTAAMNRAASGGHLHVVKWLHFNRLEGCTTAAMDGAAAGGHWEVMKWLQVNRTEGCTQKAFENAVSAGHLQIAHWLVMHYPSNDPRGVHIAPNDFDMLLLVHRFYPQVLRQEARYSYGRDTSLQELVSWLDDTFPK